MYRRNVLVAGATVLVSLAGCTDPFGNENDGPEEHVVIQSSILVRSDAGTEEESVAVVGVAEKVSDRELSFVEIRARFFDEDEELLDSTVEVIDDVTEGTRWEFEIEFRHYGEQAAKVADYELDVVTSL